MRSNHLSYLANTLLSGCKGIILFRNGQHIPNFILFKLRGFLHFLFCKSGKFLFNLLAYYCFLIFLCNIVIDMRYVVRMTATAVKGYCYGYR